jgi:hypothetical protein
LLRSGWPLPDRIGGARHGDRVIEHRHNRSAARNQPQNLQCNVKVGWGLAQCGSQASSCKNCHEVKGEDSVNAKGDWHISHAFGDFCEFCHAGNVQAADKAAAHEGLVEPLGDVKANCSSCHADDYQSGAEKYATALGVTVGASNTKPPAASSGSSQPPSQPPASQPPAQAELLWAGDGAAFVR